MDPELADLVAAANLPPGPPDPPRYQIHTTAGNPITSWLNNAYAMMNTAQAQARSHATWAAPASWITYDKWTITFDGVDVRRDPTLGAYVFIINGDRYAITDEEIIARLPAAADGITRDMLQWFAETYFGLRTSTRERKDTMLEQTLKLYTAAMSTGARGVLPHFVGPPGSGKSTTFEQLAELLGVNLHVVNVSRINPLGLEGVEMPDATNARLQLLISELWTKAEPGDIYLFDEFLRGFPEVYNGLLDIFTSRQVAGFKLPDVFIAAASNTVATYDPALEDRLIHIPVADPRSSQRERKRLADTIVKALGLHPDMATYIEMDTVLTEEVLPTYEMLDSYAGKKGRQNQGTFQGSSVRKLISQVQLRHVTSPTMLELITANNALAASKKTYQYVVLLSGKTKHLPRGYEQWAKDPSVPDQLQGVYRTNLDLNLQLIGMEEAMTAQEEGTEDDNLDV